MRLILVKCDQHAITVLELMIVLALLAALSLTVLPRFSRTLLPRYRLRHAAQHLVCDMLSAKMRAVSTNRQFRIVFNIQNNSYRIESGNRSVQSDSWALEGCAGRFSEPGNDAYFPNVRIEAASEGYIVFSPTGEQTPMSVTLAHSDVQRMKISASMAGRIRMETEK